MDNLEEVYNDLIMEHSMNSYNKKKLDNADYCELGHNPNCGDEISIELKLDGDVIEDMAFTGHGCAISQASTSIMIDTLREKELEKLEDAIAFRNIANMPARVKCALLAWHTMEDILDKNNRVEK